MIKKIKTLLTGLAVSSALLMPALVPGVVGAQANIQENLCGGVNFSLSDQTCEDSEAEASVTSIITTVVNILSLIVGVVAVIMIIIGGFKYILSGGDSGNVSTAKNTIIFAIVGLIIVALAQVIVRFVLSRATTAV